MVKEPREHSLEHLLGDFAQLDCSHHRVEEIPLVQLQAGAFQPRKHFSDQSLQALIESIKNCGILHPLIVRKTTAACYELIAGERRARAAKALGWKKVPCIVRNYSDREVLLIALIENVQRADLNVLETAQGLQRLVEECQLTHEQVARSIGWQRSSVSNMLRLLDCCAAVKQALCAEEIEMGHARALLSLSEIEQRQALEKIITGALNVRQTERLVRRMKAKNAAHCVEKSRQKEVELVDLEEKLSRFMGYRVSINAQKGGKGSLVLHYQNLDELEGILDKWGYQRFSN